MGLSRTALLLLAAAPGAARAQAMSAEEVGRAYSTMTRAGPTRAECAGAAGPDEILVCGSRDERFRLPLPNERTPVEAGRRRPGEIASQVDVMNEKGVACGNPAHPCPGGFGVDFIGVGKVVAKAVKRAADD